MDSLEDQIIAWEGEGRSQEWIEEQFEKLEAYWLSQEEAE